ncbi:spore coat U domain-containing protein [Ancylothrix sp. C2]|uniref:Csu type fimbrial protein n=1 Tax=Ancylothrix sp. D3o TaxID=2953691 RepID=UPI0021BA4E63|nr:spore coat U domain-containing protein [Ancylothrix sp. D3o]MCT7951353.1 spore coat U domain-containing protein [Ancylothrix sp. D3o]
MPFGQYDPVTANETAALNAQTALPVFCTPGVRPTSIDLDNGQNFNTTRRMAQGTNFLGYQLYKDTGRTSVWGTGATNGVVPDTSTSRTSALTAGSSAIVIYGQIPAGQDIPGGAYTDTVNITVNY